MNDIRRTILWVIFGFSMVLLWDQWQVHNGKAATFFPQSKPAVTAKAPNGATPAASSTVPAPATSASSAGGALPPGGAPATAAAPAAAPRERVTVTTDVLKLTFDSEGASVVRAELLKHAADSAADKKTSTLVLLEETPGGKYVAQTGLIGGNFPNHTTPMTFTGDRALRDGAERPGACASSRPNKAA
jgi:YidC/Oxa1 family membrane protein insertase